MHYEEFALANSTAVRILGRIIINFHLKFTNFVTKTAIWLLHLNNVSKFLAAGRIMQHSSVSGTVRTVRSDRASARQ